MGKRDGKIRTGEEARRQDRYVKGKRKERENKRGVKETGQKVTKERRE